MRVFLPIYDWNSTEIYFLESNSSCTLLIILLASSTECSLDPTTTLIWVLSILIKVFNFKLILLVDFISMSLLLINKSLSKEALSIPNISFPIVSPSKSLE